MVSNIRPMAEHEDTIEAEANFLIVQTLIEGPSTVHLAGRYYDRFVRSGEGALLLKERQVVHDTEILATDLVYPV
jgi:3-phenylpropionate/cinnamic acid dioxygenase small subunit